MYGFSLRIHRASSDEGVGVPDNGWPLEALPQKMECTVEPMMAGETGRVPPPRDFGPDRLWHEQCIW